MTASFATLLVVMGLVVLVGVVAEIDWRYRQSKSQVVVEACRDDRGCGETPCVCRSGGTS